MGIFTWTWRKNQSWTPSLLNKRGYKQEMLYWDRPLNSYWRWWFFKSSWRSSLLRASPIITLYFRYWCASVEPLWLWIKKTLLWCCSQLWRGTKQVGLRFLYNIQILNLKTFYSNSSSSQEIQSQLYGLEIFYKN